MNSKSVIKNASWIILTKVVQSILALIISVLTARYLGPSNFGTINYATSIIAFVLPIMHLGLTSIIVDELITNPKDEGKTLGTSILASFISSLLCILGVFIFVNIVNFGEKETIAVCMLYSIVLIVQTLDVFGYWFQSKLMSKYVSLTSLFAYIIITIYKIFLLVTNKSIEWFAISNALDVLIINLILFVLYKRKGGMKLSFSKPLLKRLLNKSKYYILSGIMISVFAQTDRIMLKLMIDESATGYYSAAIYCAGLSGFIFSAIIDSVRPVIFKSKSISKTAVNKNIIRLYSIIIYLALLQNIFITIFAKYIINILYGIEFNPAINTLRLVVWYTTFSYIGAVRNIWLLAENRQNMIWKIDLSGAIANIILNLMLIPKWGIMGAAFASLCTQFIANVIMVGIFKESRPNIKFMIESLSIKNVKELLIKIRCREVK